MNITRDILIEKINNKDKRWFYQLYNHDCPDQTRDWSKEFNIVYDENWGDGNDYFIAFEFPLLKLYVLLEGQYSSWDEPHWSSVSFAQPFEYKETRYKPVTLEYIRDQKIETILDKSEDKKD